MTLSLSQSAAAKLYVLSGGQKVTLPNDESLLTEPTVSPDGRHAAYVRAAGKRLDEDDPQPSEVVIVNRRTGKTKVLVHPGAPASRWYLRPVIRVTFAVNGSHVFVERAFPGTSHSVHDIDLATGKERLVGWGDDIAVLRDGPWRGNLLMGIHTCYESHSGCDYPVHVVTSSGKSVYVVPGTSGVDRASKLHGWLGRRGWGAW